MSVEYELFKQRVMNQRKVLEVKQALADKQRTILKELLTECPHEEIEQKSSYFEGSYYDKAYTEYWNQCKLCGKTSEKTTNMHSWYG